MICGHIAAGLFGHQLISRSEGRLLEGHMPSLSCWLSSPWVSFTVFSPVGGRGVGPADVWSLILLSSRRLLLALSWVAPCSGVSVGGPLLPVSALGVGKGATLLLSAVVVLLAVSRRVHGKT